MNGKILTTKLDGKGDVDNDDDEDEQQKMGFERLPDEGHKIGLYVLSMHEFMVGIIKKEKVRNILFILSFCFV